MSTRRHRPRHRVGSARTTSWRGGLAHRPESRHDRRGRPHAAPRSATRPTPTSRGGTSWWTPPSSSSPSTTPTSCSTSSAATRATTTCVRRPPRRRPRTLAREIGAAGGQVAMFVTDSRLPDVDHIFEAFHRWRVVVPTARRVIAAHWDHFLRGRRGLRIGLAKGKYDAYLLMPRGVRDEEFHTAISELLSDWGSTVAQPEVGQRQDRLADPGRADAGDPRLPRPDGHAEPRLRTRTTRAPGLPGRDPRAARRRRPALAARRRRPYRGADPGHERARRGVAIYGRPDDIDVDDGRRPASSAPGPAGLAAAVYGASEGLTVVVLRPRRSAARPAPAR